MVCNPCTNTTAGQEQPLKELNWKTEPLKISKQKVRVPIEIWLHFVEVYEINNVQIFLFGIGNSKSKRSRFIENAGLNEGANLEV